MICVSLVLIRNVDKSMAWILPLLSDKDAKMKVQFFVLCKDTADILGNTINDGNDKILNFNHGVPEYARVLPSFAKVVPKSSPSHPQVVPR